MMGAKIFATVALIGILIFVGTNTYIIGEKIDGIIEDIEAVKNGDDAKAAREGFSCCERYISMSVDHDYLTGIEDMFMQFEAEMLFGDEGGEITRARLINALTYLKALSGFTIEAII